MLFNVDPLLDERCTCSSPSKSKTWDASWVWYPGQLSAHLLQNAMQKSLARCVHVGYPGSFRLPEYRLFLRKTCVLNEPVSIRWQVPRSRARLFINGQGSDVTQRNAIVPAGDIELLMVLDFAETLPCLILEGASLATDASWEVSLDRDSWAAAECEPRYNTPTLLPDTCRDLTVSIPPQELIRAGNTDTDGSDYRLRKAGDVVIDFGHTELGSLSLDLSGEGRLSVAVGQSLIDVLNDDVTLFEQYPLPAIDVPSRLQSVTLPERCIRFARFQSSADCSVKNVKFQARVAPISYHGSFECSDSLLNSIWVTGAATIHACLHDFYLDGLLRDGLPWALDGLSSIEAADCVFFDARTVRQTILSQTLPPHPSPQDLGILDFPFYVVLACLHDYQVRGDLSFVQGYQDRLFEILALYESLQDNGSSDKDFIGAMFDMWGSLPGFLPDWAANAHTGPDLSGTPTYAQMLLMRSFEIGSEFAHLLGDRKRHQRYANRAVKLRAAIRAHFWDAEQGAYVNGFDRHGQLDKRFSSYAQVFGILFDLISPVDWNRVIDSVLTNPALRAPNIGFNSHWEFLAYAKADRIELALTQIRSVWGGMLGQGFTRFFEDIRPADDDVQRLQLYGRPFANSLCHGWAGAAPVAALSRGVLGITPDAPGYAVCRIHPRLGDLQWVRGSIPTPSGNISLDYARGKGGALTLPDNVTAHLDRSIFQGNPTQLVGPGTYHLTAGIVD